MTLWTLLGPSVLLPDFLGGGLQRHFLSTQYVSCLYGGIAIDSACTGSNSGWRCNNPSKCNVSAMLMFLSTTTICATFLVIDNAMRLISQSRRYSKFGGAAFNATGESYMQTICSGFAPLVPFTCYFVDTTH